MNADDANQAQGRTVGMTPTGTVSRAAGTGHKGADLMAILGNLQEKLDLQAELLAALPQMVNGAVARIEQKMEELKRGQAKLLASGKAEASEAVSESETSRVFKLMQSLDDGDRKRKAPLGRVFRLTVLEGRPQKKVALLCDCTPSLISRRVASIEKTFDTPIKELRSMASPILDLESTVKGERRRPKKSGALPEDADPDDHDSDRYGAWTGDEVDSPEKNSDDDDD